MTIRALSVLVATAAAIAAPSTASAQAFTQLTCSACPTMTEVDFTYQVGGNTGVWELPNDPTNSSNYINNLYHKRWLVGNAYIRSADLRFDSFQTESGFDFFSYNLSGLGSIDLTGMLATPAWKSPGPSAGSLQGAPLYMIFKTDFSVTKTGFSIGRARVCCGSADSTISPIEENDRFYGVLLGLNDTVFMKYYPRDSSEDITIALWGNGVVSDIDLYVRCDAIPSFTAWDYRGYSEDAQEFVHIPAGQCPVGHVLYIAVNAFDVGTPKTYSLAVHNHNPGYHIGGIIAKTLYNATSAQITSWQTTLQKGARRFFGLNEGSIYMDSVQVRNNTGTGESIQLSSGSSRPYTDGPLCSGTSKIHLFAGWPDQQLYLAHESGHFWGCLPDEYHDVGGSSQSHCGHSFMGNFYQSPMNNNFCFCNSWNGTSCATNMGDHDHDGNVSPNNNAPAVWSVFPTYPYINRPTYTPDNYNYENFDFNGLMAAIVP